MVFHTPYAYESCYFLKHISDVLQEYTALPNLLERNSGSLPHIHDDYSSSYLSIPLGLRCLLAFGSYFSLS